MTIKIAVITNWTSSQTVYELWKKQSQDSQGKWNDIQLVAHEADADIYVIVNSIYGLSIYDASLRYPDAHYFLMEPYAPDGWSEVKKYFKAAHTHDICTNVGEWHIGLSYGELMHKSFNLKYDRISTVQSCKNYDPGHRLRLSFIDELNRTLSNLYCYGSYQTSEMKHYMGRLPPYQKEEGLQYYKYHFAAENHAIDNYFTEKIIDGILMECLVFYWGCPNLEQYLPSDSFIRLSLTNFEEDIAVIQRAIRENWWETRLPAIRKAKTIILNQLQFFPLIENLIKNNDMHPTP